MSYFGSWVAGPPRAMSERVQRRNTNQQQIGISEVGVPETSSTVVTYISCNGLVLAEMLALWIAIDAMLSAFLLNKGKMSTLSIAIQHPTRNLTKKKKKRHWDLKGWQKKKKNTDQCLVTEERIAYAVRSREPASPADGEADKRLNKDYILSVCSLASFN